MPSRRSILRASAAALAGCATPPTAGQLATDANLIASGLQGILPELQQIPQIPPAVLAKITTSIAQIQSDAAKIAGESANAAKPWVQDIAELVQAVATAALPFIPAGSVAGPALQAALALLPVILAVVGLSGAAVVPHFPPDTARMILRAAAAPR